MSRIRYNGKILEYIPQILKVSTRNVCIRLGVKCETFSKWKNDSVKVVNVLRTCETFGTSMYYFFTPESFDYDMDDIQLNLVPWEPVEIRLDVLTTALIMNGQTKKDVCRRLGINHKTFEKMQNNIIPPSLTVKTVLGWLEDSGLRIGDVFKDYNIEAIAHGVYSDRGSDIPDWYATEFRVIDESKDEKIERLEHIAKMFMQRNQVLEKRLKSYEI